MGSYSNINDHHSMFFDEVRNNYYFNAIQKVVNKESVVLDLGAGLGVLGLMALEAGAKKVYLVEPASIIETTRMVIKANNLSERVVCIEGKIEEVELPEKVDVIISVFTGNFLLSEDLLPSLFYARDRFLRSGGKLIPDRAKMIAVPVSFSPYYTKYIECWSKSLYGIDFNVVRGFAANNMYCVNPQKKEIKFLSEPAEIAELDFMEATEASCRNTIEMKVSQKGKLDGFLGWFDVRLGDEWLSTSPMEKSMHWSQMFLPLKSPIEVHKDDNITFTLTRPEFSEWSWIIKSGAEVFKHSTFLSEPLRLFEVKKEQDSYEPQLSEKGKMTREILGLCNGNISSRDIVLKIYHDFTHMFCSYEEAERFVKKSIIEYA